MSSNNYSSDDEDYESILSEASSFENEQETSQQAKEELARQETAAVLGLRLLVFLVLFLAAVAVSIIVFYVTSGAEVDESKTQYDGAAQKVLQAFSDIVNSKLGAVSSLGVASIAHGVDHYRTWPFVTLSSFQQRSATARSQSGSLYVHMNPYVTDEDRKEWEAFVVSNDSSWM